MRATKEYKRMAFQIVKNAMLKKAYEIKEEPLSDKFLQMEKEVQEERAKLRQSFTKRQDEEFSKIPRIELEFEALITIEEILNFLRDYQ